METNNQSILLLSHQDLLESGCFNMKRAIDVAEQTLIDFSMGNVLYPSKVSQIFNEESQHRINCLPATLFTQKVCGMKWVSVFPDNPQKFGLQNLTAVILLSQIVTGFPIAFMEGTLCSDLRTAAISSIAAKYLARKDSESIGFIGAGEQAQMHFIGLKTVLPNLKVCKVASRTSESEHLFIQNLSKLYKDVEFMPCDSNYCQSATDSDIIVTAISAQAPILQSEWLKEGCFYCHVGGWEDDYSVPLSVNKIVCDDWESVKHRTQTVSRLYQMGKLSDSDIHANLHEVVTSKKTGRTTTSEKVYFNAVGLSYVDVALAYDMYEMAKQNGKGHNYTLREKRVFEDFENHIVL